MFPVNRNKVIKRKKIVIIPSSSGQTWMPDNMGIQAYDAYNFVASEKGVESMYQMVNENEKK